MGGLSLGLGGLWIVLGSVAGQAGQRTTGLLCSAMGLLWAAVGIAQLVLA